MNLNYAPDGESLQHALVAGDASIQIAGETKVDRSQFDLGWNRFGMIGATATATAQAVFVRATR